MNFKTLSILIILFCSIDIQAQKKTLSKDFNVQISIPYRVIDAETKWYINNDSYVVAVKITKKRDVHIQTWDAKSLNLIKTEEFDDFDRKVVFSKFYEADGHFYLFYSLWDKDLEVEQLFVREIDPKTAKFKDAGRKLLEVEDKIAGNLNRTGVFSAEVVDKFNFQHSKNGEKLLIQYRLKPEIKNDSKNFDKIGLYVFDKNLNQQWFARIELPYTEKKMDVFDYSVNSSGDVYIVSKVYKDDSTDDKKHRKDVEPNYHMELFVVDAATQTFKAEEIELENKFVKSIVMFESDENYMVMGGYYADAHTSSGVQGAFVFKVRKDGELYDKYFHEVPFEIINQNASKREAKRNAKKEMKDELGLNNLKLDRIVTMDDGSVLLIGEEYQLVVNYYTDSNGNTRTTYTYYYSDILLTKISSNGRLEWMHKIPKNQVGKAPKGGMSYEYLSNNKSHYILYLDNIKNLQLRSDEVPDVHSDGRGGFLTSTKVEDATGNASKVSLFDLRDVKGMKVYQFSTDRIVQLSENEIAIEVYKKKKEDIWIRVGLQ